MTKVAAVDVGATSGRVLTAELGASGIRLEEISRFPNHPRLVDGSWTWDVEGLHASVLEGLANAVGAGALACGIDTWAVDYGVLLDGELMGPVRAYRDPRHASGIAPVQAALPWEALYRITGTQHMPINTIYQLAADERLVEGTTFLMVPDLLSWWLTGELGVDATNASTTGMVDVRTRTWSPAILAGLGLPRSAFLDTSEPGRVRGIASDSRLNGIPLVGVATHDTASAFAGAPLHDRETAMVLSLGTWALIGAESVGATPTDESRLLNVTHELGVDGTVRVLKNVCGMWLLEECRRAWAADDGDEPGVPDLLLAAEGAQRFAAIFDVDAPDLAVPGQSPHTIGRHLVGSWDGSRGAVVRTILESLVARIAVRALQIERLLGSPRSTLHVVGGASRMTLVMQWLADATGKVVIAGPVEATAIGNAVVQWQALGELGTLAEARELVSAMPEVRTYEPDGSKAAWREFGSRLLEAA